MKMVNKDIIGGVSPLKKSAYSARGYTGRTRFKPDEKWKPPASGGTFYYGKKSPEIEKLTKKAKDKAKKAKASAGAGSKSTGPSGYYEPIYEDVTTNQDLQSYQTVWDANKDNLQGKYEGDFDKWVTAADQWWKDEAKKANMSVEEFRAGYKKSKTERKLKGYQYVQTDPGSSTSWSKATVTTG